MSSVKKCLVAAAAVFTLAGGVASPVFADPPGPGDKQCIPGLNSPPQPGKKGGTCPP